MDVFLIRSDRCATIIRSLVNEHPHERRIRDKASYIADMARELAFLASEHELAILRYLLKMASDEALSVATPPPTDDNSFGTDGLERR